MINRLAERSAVNRLFTIGRNAAGGFTLLELVVVMGILAVISAAITPVYVIAMDSIRMRNAKNDVIAIIRYAQEMAVRESREHRVYFDKDKGSYRLVRLAGQEDGEKVFEPAVSPNSLYQEEELLPQSLAFENIRARRDRTTREYFVSCLPNGASDKVVIKIRDQRSRGNNLEISVEGPLGKITLEESG
jgi:prepilin-type N-terminal cleavage/methylation domain-containing protein